MEERMIAVPYEDFVDGTKAMADLDCIRSMIRNGSDYCSDSIKAVLGLSIEKEHKPTTFDGMLEE